MPQKFYKAPLTYPIRIFILSVFDLSGALSCYFVRFKVLLTKTLLTIYFALQIVNVIVNPEVRCILVLRRDPEDGTRKIMVG